MCFELKKLFAHFFCALVKCSFFFCYCKEIDSMLFVNISSMGTFISLVLNEASKFPFSIYVLFVSFTDKIQIEIYIWLCLLLYYNCRSIFNSSSLESYIDIVKQIVFI